MIIRQYSYNRPRGSGPMEIRGSVNELIEVAGLFGFHSLTAWRIALFAKVESAFGREYPSAIVTPNQYLNLARKSAQVAIEEISPHDITGKPLPSVAHTGTLELATRDTQLQNEVVSTILSFVATAPPRHERI